MENLKFLNRIVVLTIGILLFTGCGEIEPMIELQLEKQATGEVFTFADYCEETYDSVYIILPYEDEDIVYSLPYKMSSRLRGRCSYTQDDCFTNILFIENGIVKAYSKIGSIYASFSFIEFPNNKPILNTEQKLILDNKRFVHIYNE